MNYISLKNLFKTYQYFNHHFIIKNIFTNDICDWFCSYSKIETNSFLLFSILHVLDLVNTNYNINFHIKYSIQHIKMIVNNKNSLYSSFLYNCDFKLIIPLSNCIMKLENEYSININRGNIVVLTGDRDFVLTEEIKFVSIDIVASFDVNAISNGPYYWWIKHLPFKDNTCLKYI